MLIARSIPSVGMTVPMTQTTGAWAGLRRAVCELGAKKIWIEGDSSGCPLHWV